jgi:hypothetical protein
VHQADTAAFVPAHVQHDTAALAGHHRQRRVQLWAAVAAPGTEDIAGETFRVHPHEYVVPVALWTCDVAAHQRNMLDLVVDAGVADRPELAVPGGDTRLGDALDVLFVLATPFDEVGDRDERQAVLVGENAQLIGLRHRAFVLLADDLADGTGGLQAREPGQVDSGLGVARAAQYATILGAQRDDVAGPGEVIGDAGRICEQPHRGRAIRGRNPCSDTIFRIHRDRVRRTVLVLIHGVHGQQAQFVADRAVQRDAQIAGRVPHHESDELGSRHLGGEDEIALVLAVLVVDDHHGLTRGDVSNCPLHGVQPRHHISMNHLPPTLIAAPLTCAVYANSPATARSCGRRSIACGNAPSPRSWQKSTPCPCAGNSKAAPIVAI